MAEKIRQHEPLRVPQGWTSQDRAFVIQLERVLTDLYRIFGILDGTAVKEVAYNATTQKLTMTIGGEVSDIVRVATLDGNGKVPASQLPSYVDDVEEYADMAHFPATGETDKIYVAKDTGFTYRWSGTQYVRLNTYDEATQNASGLMSAADKTKLDGVAEGATDNIGTITSIKMNGVTISVSGEADLGTVITAHQDISGKADKVSGGTENNFAALDASGNLKDSGHKHSDYLTSHQDISGKADKVSSPTENNFAALDANGNLKDSGHKHSDYITDVSDKADKSNTVTSVDFDGTNNKITKTINGSTTDVVTVAAIKAALGAFTHDQLAGL